MKMNLLIEERQAVYFQNHRVDISAEEVVLCKIQFLIHHITVYASVCFQWDLFVRSGPFEFGQSVKPFDCIWLAVMNAMKMIGFTSSVCVSWRLNIIWRWWHSGDFFKEDGREYRDRLWILKMIWLIWCKIFTEIWRAAFWLKNVS